MGGKSAAPDGPRLLPAGSVNAAVETSRDDVSVALSIDSPPSLHRSAVKSWRGERQRSDAGAPELRHGFGEGGKGNARGSLHGAWEEGGSAAGGAGLASSSVEMLGMLSVSLQVRGEEKSYRTSYISCRYVYCTQHDPDFIRPEMTASAACGTTARCEYDGIILCCVRYMNCSWLTLTLLAAVQRQGVSRGHFGHLLIIEQQYINSSSSCTLNGAKALSYEHSSKQYIYFVPVV